jgi:hypothetical protein
VNGAGLEIVVIMGGIEMAVGPGTGKGVRAETVAMIDEVSYTHRQTLVEPEHL